MNTSIPCHHAISRHRLLMSMRAGLALFVLLIATTPSARGGTYEWTAGDGSWATASNWASDSVPGLGSTVILPAQNDFYTVTFNENYTTSTELYYLEISGGLNQISTLSQGDGTTMITGIDEDIGESEFGQTGTASYVQSGGSNLVGGSLYLGGGTEGGAYNLTGDAILTVSGSELVGVDGAEGDFYQNGGTNTVDTTLQVGSSLSTGTYDLISGPLVAGQEIVTGTSSKFVQVGGTNTVDNAGGSASLYVGYGSGNAGNYQLQGGNLSADVEYIGDYGTGTFTQTGGVNGSTTGIAPYIYLGANGGDSGTYTLSGTGTISATRESVGYLGSGKFIQQGGSNQVGLLFLGGGVDLSDNTVTGTGGSYELDGGTLSAGFEDMYGSSSFTQTGGTNTTSDDLDVGGNTGGNSVYTLSGDSTVQLSVGGLEEIGQDGTGSFTQNGGKNTAIGLYLASHPGSSGSYTLEGGTLDATDGEAVNNLQGASGTFTQMGGSNSAGVFIIVGGSSGGTGTYTLESGQASAGLYEFINNGGTFTQSGGTNTITNSNANGSLEIGGGGSYELDSGAQLSADNEYIGTDTGTPTASFVQKGGTNTVTPGGSLYVGGYNDGNGHTISGNGSYEMDGGKLNVSSNDLERSFEYIGYSGNGTFTQTDGSNTTDHLALGNNSNTTGSYQLSKTGILNAGVELIGYGGIGTFTQTGATNTTSTFIMLDNGSSYSLDGNGTFSASYEAIGVDNSPGTAPTFTQSSGTNTDNGNLEIGEDSGCSGIYLLKGGTLSVTGYYEAVGFSGSGSLIQSGDSVNKVTGDLFVGYTSGINTDSGSYELDTGSLSADTENIGWESNENSSFTQKGGANVTGALTVGRGFGGTGSYGLSGTGTLTATSEIIGKGFADVPDQVGIGTFTQTGGTNTVSNMTGDATLVLGDQSSSSGSYELDGGTLSSTYETIGNQGSGTFTQTTNSADSSNAVTDDLTLGAQSGGSGTYNLEGGALSANNEIIGSAGSGAFNQTGGSNTLTGQLTLGGNSSIANYYILNPASGVTATLSAASEVIGAGAQIDQYGGTNTVSGLLQLGDDSGVQTPSATYFLFGGNLNTSAGAQEIVGYNGNSADFDQTGGTNNISGGSLAVDNGVYNLTGGTLTASNTPGNFLTQSGAFFDMNGTGTENGYLQNFGTFDYSGGTFNGTLENDGSASIGGSFTAGLGIINNTFITLESNGNLYGGGAIGLDNEGEIDIAGNTIGGTSTLNDGLISGYGTINGANFSNYGLVTQGAGNLTLSATGTNANYANIDLASGRQFRLTGGTLTNEGTLALNGGIVTGTAKLENSVGGVVTGSGSILGTFQNDAGGTVEVNAGTTSISKQFTNAGLISMTSATANLAGAGVTNMGTIQGLGNVGSTSLANNGIIEAEGGTLGLNGTVTNSSTGAIYAGTGDKVLVSNGLAANAGLINLTGGTYDNNGHALSNTGEISGYGTYRTGGLTTSGTVSLAGGNSTVNGAVTETAGTVNIYNPTTFTNAVTVNGGTFTTHQAQTDFAGGLTLNGGSFNNDPATVQVTNLTVNAPAGLTGGTDSLYQVSGNVSNSSPNFKLAAGGLELVSGTSNSHTFNWSVNTGVEDIGTLTIDSGQKVDFENGGNTNAALAVLSFQLADGLGAANSTALQTDISTDLTGDLTIYYDPNTSADSYLEDKTYTFGDGGRLEAQAVPEPASWAMLLVGLGMLIGLRLTRRTAQS